MSHQLSMYWFTYFNYTFVLQGACSQQTEPDTKSKYVFKQLAQQELDNPSGDSPWLRDLLFALPACNIRNQGKSQRAVTLGGSTH